VSPTGGNGNGWRKRLEVLESLEPPEEFGEFSWTLLEQCEAVVEAVRYAARFSGMPYPATDRELGVLGLLVAIQELGEEPGVHRFPSGATVRVTEDIETYGDIGLFVRGRVLISDLPDQVARYVTRMTAWEQEERDRQLPLLWRAEEEMHHRAEEARRRRRKEGV
jgi:hypothetical protein